MFPMTDSRHRFGWGSVLLGLALLGAFAPSVDAAKIKSKLTVARKVEGKSLAWWDNYYTRALANRQVKGIQVPVALRRRLITGATITGLLPDAPLVDYLRFRRSLNPAVFDQNHESLGPLISRDTIIRNNPPPLPPPPPIVPIPGVVTPPAPQVPEPSSVLIAIALSAAGLIAHRARQRVA
jgi:hypothetical protein